ncbi:MAG: aldo/keto reductase [gamma proteobacterium symbiont of Taylorina sp.]|nr:aldo/keto reductase [gamma proteobacterium symbiont of Taylorina sp.]
MLINRRLFLKTLYGIGLSLFYPSLANTNIKNSYLTREIPKTKESIPVIGMGTWISFNVGHNLKARNERTKVLDTFFQLGGGLIDSSPMYGSAEEVLGYALKKIGKPQPTLFSATKVWTSSLAEGNEQYHDSLNLWGVKQLDLYQIHNLLGWKKHLPILQNLKRDGKIRYIGMTTSHGRRHDELENIIRHTDIDFVQLTYNILDREVENRLLPAAQDNGVAIIANRPFQGGELFSQFAHQPLPVWSKEIDCHNWAQFFLKFTISHPAITCAIPATSQVSHMIENMGAMQGRLPDANMRTQMIEYINKLNA